MGLGQRMLDPETGLELEVLIPAPSAWSADSVRGRMLANDPTQGGVTSNPFIDALQVQSTIPDPSLQPSSDPMAVASGTTASGGDTLESSSLLEKAMFTLFGTPDSMMTAEEESTAHGKRDNAAALAKSSAENPGAAHMGIPSASGGSSLGEMLSFLPGLIKGLSGLV
jgi:hypothetical protein